MGAESKLSAEAAARFVLGLSQGCTKEDVKRAFRRLALVFHPDKNKGQNEEEATKRFQAIATAKDLLLKTSGGSGHSTKDTGARRPTTPAAKSEATRKASYVAMWMCGACQMRHLGSSPGSSRTSEVACARASSSTLCFCGHRFGVHELVEGAGVLKFRCRQQGCACGSFSYVPPGALCTCGHGPQSHDAKPFHSCQVSGCLCQTFHHAGVCSCRHSWACHRTEIQKGVSPYAGKPEPKPKSTFCPWRRPCEEPDCSDEACPKRSGTTSPTPTEPREAKTASSSRPPSARSPPPAPPTPATPPPPVSAQGRGASAPSTPTGRRSSASGETFFMPKSAGSATRCESPGGSEAVNGAARERSFSRLDVRGKPIGRCPSVPTPTRGASPPVPAASRSPSPSATAATAAGSAPSAGTSQPSAWPSSSEAGPESTPQSTAWRCNRPKARPSSAPPGPRREREASVSGSRDEKPPMSGPAMRPPRPRPSSAGAKGPSTRGSAPVTVPGPGTGSRDKDGGAGKETVKKTAEKSNWEDPSAEPDAEPDTDAEQGSHSPDPPQSSAASPPAKIPRSAEAPVWSKRSASFSIGNPHGCASKVAAAAAAAAAAKAGAKPWWLRLHQSKMPEEAHDETNSSEASAETVDPEPAPKVAAASAAEPQPSRAEAQATGRPVTRRPPRPSTPPLSPRHALPRRPPVPRAPRPAPRAPRPASAPPKRTLPTETVVTEVPTPAPTLSAKNCWQSTHQAKLSATMQVEEQQAASGPPEVQQEVPKEERSRSRAPSWPWVSPRFFGADSDDEGQEGGVGTTATTRSQSQQTLRRLMELQRTLPTPFL